jgi:hypothetical protein
VPKGAPREKRAVEEAMEQMIERLGYVTFATMVIAAAAGTALLIREIPGIARYIRISRM